MAGPDGRKSRSMGTPERKRPDPIGHDCVLQGRTGQGRVKAIIPTNGNSLNPGMETGMANAPLTHNQIWTALDRLAARSKLSPSGLAKRSGLDPTTFNKSKRITPDGRARWPSTESIAKALSATSVSVESFVSLISESNGSAQAIPLIGFAEAGASGYFHDGGFPSGKGWDEIAFPGVVDEHAYALEISGDSMLPAYRDGDVIIVSPAAPVRRGDRVVVKTGSGELMIKELKRQTAQQVELKSLHAERPERTLTLEDVAWISRVVWASQ